MFTSKKTSQTQLNNIISQGEQRLKEKDEEEKRIRRIQQLCGMPTYTNAELKLDQDWEDGLHKMLKQDVLTFAGGELDKFAT